MPELPDVEWVARRLRRSIGGRRVTRIEIRDRSVVRSPSPRLFAGRLRGRRIRTVGRRGKYLLVYLDGDLVIVGHLRMTGDFAVVPRHEPLRPHTRLVLGLGAGDLRFVDQRRFGHVDVIAARELETFRGLRTLGVEPLTPAFSLARLRALIDDRRGTLKGFLLRQDLIAGIGNIYADEILFQARLHPARPLRSLRPAQVRALHRAVRAALRRGVAALARRGRAIGRRSSVREGDLVAVREKGGACPRCGGPLRIAAVAGRTTYFCPRCQR
ncbi:MAG TPA: bifunctional DNA-formamidopyrimidine glycosylase/DNA-(apurinic or apyrimidinic site) lyase [bacterium]|nr:bifunctional DNA-formamidopyrimidine glycosylase/DNA-(apurinic or apyrimidinic site) lyase [bacterium]